jgi:hypothetical protein
MTWKYFIIHPIGHLVSLLKEHLHYLSANPKELTMQYHFLECDHRINKLGQVWRGFQDAFRSSVSWIQTSANNIGSSISNAIKMWSRLIAIPVMEEVHADNGNHFDYDLHG